MLASKVPNIPLFEMANSVLATSWIIDSPLRKRRSLQGEIEL
jgi:hypothetical protein